jgi:lipopolysaccharide/colanic/teichoic acid biosynthesis glycosyltransferase
MTIKHRKDRFYGTYGKRLFDLVFGSIALILSAPLLVVLSLVALCLQGVPILFRQTRPGKDERLFTLLKLRTMDEAPHGASDAQRLTPIGRFLRRTSLDELPSLWNVMRGDMSLVGPRPLLEEYLPMYDDEQRRRHCMRPGLTGWAQVRGRNDLTWPQKFAYDVWYVDHCTFALDLKIIAMTLFQVIRGRGISAPEHATMPRFKGTEND